LDNALAWAAVPPEPLDLVVLTFLPLAPLSTDIEQLVRQISNHETRLANTRRLDSSSKDILICRYKVGSTDSGYRVEVAVEREGRVVSDLERAIAKAT
jgi:hypothetical protein